MILKKRVVSILLSLICLITSVTFIPYNFLSALIVSSVELTAEKEEDIFSKASIYPTTITKKTEDVEIVDVANQKYMLPFIYDEVSYDLEHPKEGKVVSDKAPKITFLAAGLGGSAYHWSNNGTNVFEYNPDSIIEKIIKKVDCNIYIARFSGWIISGECIPEFEFLKVARVLNADNEIHYECAPQNQKPDVNALNKTIDTSKHVIIVLDPYAASNSNDFIYYQFNLMASTAIAAVANDDPLHQLPKVNLIGHSRGGITNLQFALDHPDIVESVFSMSSPYVGSTSASIDHYLLNNQYSYGSTGETDIAERKTYSKYMQRWNDGYDQLYSKVKLHAIGSYSSVDMLIYSLVRYALPQLPNKEILKTTINIMNHVTAVAAILPFSGGILPFETCRHLAGIILDKLTVAYKGKITSDVILGIRSILELALCEIDFNLKTLSYDIKNDGLVDLASQLGYERETGEGFKGFINYIRKFSIYEDIDNAGACDGGLIKAVHNLVTLDAKINDYVMEHITFCSE